MLFNLDAMPAMQAGRLRKALNRQFRFSDGVMTLGEKLAKEHAAGGLTKSESDSMIDYNRRRFNAMNIDQQVAYIRKLESRRRYWVNRPDGSGWEIPKIVFDAMQCPAE